MRAKSFIYALLAMVVVGVAASCQRHDEEPPRSPPEPTPESPYYVYGYGGDLNLQVVFRIDSIYEVHFVLECGDERYIIPEGEYLFCQGSTYINDGSRLFYSSDTGGWNGVALVDASLVVEHVGNEYHFIAHAEGENGDVFDVDWTGCIEAVSSSYPIYNPGEAPAE